MTTQQASTKQDILQCLLKQGEMTAHDLAGFLAISPQATRRHLKDLETSGLIQHKSIQAGMGRPQYRYFLSAAGREQFPNRYGEFTVSLLDSLAETVSEEQFGAVLRKQWERKALAYRDRIGSGTLAQRLAALVAIRQAEGYVAELYPVESKPGQYVFVEHNCAIAEVANSFPTVCGHELEMFATILPDCWVERTNWLKDGEHQCGYLMRSR